MNRRFFLKSLGAAGSLFLLPKLSFGVVNRPKMKPQNRREINQWLRFYYNNNSEFAMGIDRLSGYIGIENCSVESHIKNELVLMGDVFIYRSPMTFEYTILDSDFLEIYENGLFLIPDENVRKVVATKFPINVYSKIPDDVKNLIIKNKPIFLSSKNTQRITSPLSHFEGNEVKNMDFRDFIVSCSRNIDNWLKTQLGGGKCYTTIKESCDFGAYQKTVETLVKIKNGKI